MAIALAGSSATMVIGSLILSLGLNGFAMSGFHVTHVDMAPDFAGTLMGITNGISNFNGIIAPRIVTLLTNEQGDTHWWLVFLIATGVYLITGLVFCFFGTSNLQSWAVKKQSAPELVVVVNGSGAHGPPETAGCDGSCARKSGMLNGVNQFCCQLSQNYSNLRKSSNNFTVFDRKLGSRNSDSLVAMCANGKAADRAGNQHVNTAFNGDLDARSEPKADAAQRKEQGGS